MKKVFGLLGKDSSGGEESNTGRSGSRFRSGRRDSETATATQNGIASPPSTPHNLPAQSRTGNDGGLFYRSRNARSMDALKLFTKSSKPPTPASKANLPAHQRMSSGGNMDATTANVIILRPSGGGEKDIAVLRAEDDDADDTGNGSTSTESDRSPRTEGNSYVDAQCTTSRMSTSSGIGGPPPAGAKGAVHLPSSPPRNSTSQSDPIDSPIEPLPIRPRPPKPSLSIPIPPPTFHEKAASASAILPTQSPVSGSSTAVPATRSAFTPSQKGKPPPSPGLSLRLTPSIVMSRPVWPLPPLPPMPTDIPPVPPSLSGGSGVGSGLTWNTSNGKTLPLFRLSPPSRSMTGPTTSNSSPSSAGAEGAGVRRSVSVKLNAMPSLSVMGETEHGDPEADDMMDEDEEDGDGDGDDDMEEEIPRGRPSIDSMMSIDSVTSVETVRAPPPPLTLQPPSRLNTQQVAVAGPIAPEDKGKGKAKKASKDSPGGDDGSASDSDESVYFDARGSVFLSPRDVAQALERRHSQISQRNRDSRVMPSSSTGHGESGPGIGRREGLRDVSRERRDSSWSFSTVGRESVYLTPSEGSTWSSAATSATHGISTASDLAHSGFATEVASKRSSVPVTFGATVGNAAAGSLGSRRGAASRFSMTSAAELPNIDSSTLNFDSSSFAPRTPTPGLSIKGKGHGGAALPPLDGLPTTRREGLPNFDAAIPATGKAVNESEVATPKEREQRTDDYFNTRKNHPSGSPSAQRRRGSLSASVHAPPSIAEDATEPEKAPPLSPLQSSIPSATSTRPSILTYPKRPSVYRQASRSMVDLSMSSDMTVDAGNEGEDDHKVGGGVLSGPPSLTSSTPIRSAPSQGDPMAWLVPPPSPAITRPLAHHQSTIRRVSSFPLLQSMDMPITVVDKPPPAYHAIPRREEEGKETLPGYFNDIILAGLLPRKMEFDKPGLQARDRSWKKVWCVLQGTMLRVYKVGTLEVKFGALSAAPVAGALPINNSSSVLNGGRSRSSTFGVSAIAGRRGSNATPPVLPATSEKVPLSGSGRPEVYLTRNQNLPNSPGLLVPPSTGSPASSSNSAWNSGSSQAPSRSSFSSSRPTTPARPATGGSIPQSPVHGSTLSSRSREQEKPMGHGLNGGSVIDNGGFNIYTPASSSLIHQYTLQNAESGLATDYMKRRNVIRIRLEGEQFLLQLPGVEEVVEWIEVSFSFRLWLWF